MVLCSSREIVSLKSKKNVVVLPVHHRDGKNEPIVSPPSSYGWTLPLSHNAKKENQIFLIDKKIHIGAVAKSYTTNGLVIYGEIFAHFLIY
jgi:hypothetical protein